VAGSIFAIKYELGSVVMVRFEIKYSYNHVALGVKRYEACITFESYSPPSKTHVIDTD